MLPLLIPALSFLGGALFSGKNGNSQQLSGGGSDFATLLRQIPELRQTFDLQNQQMRRQDPLHAALTQLALNFLPRGAFNVDPRRQAMINALPSSVKPYQVGLNANNEQPTPFSTRYGNDGSEEDRRNL